MRVMENFNGFVNAIGSNFRAICRQARAADGMVGEVLGGLGPNVAAELAPLPWRVLRQAAEPTQAALLAAIDDDLNRGFSP